MNLLLMTTALALGALSAVGLFIAGQMLASLTVDGFGWLGVAAQPLGVSGVLGGLAVLGGAALITRTGATGAPLAHRPAWIAFALTAGAGLAVQGRSTPSSAPISTPPSLPARLASSSPLPRWALS